jgi:NAD(P)-dependent dehydrogenase (short-subunit alcohol dehydrogenase family)
MPAVESGLLRDKVIVVIGGTSGLGLSAARAFLAAGGRVACVGADEESAARARSELGDGTPVLVGDAAKPGAAERLIDAAVARWSRLDGLYHVAGGSGRRAGDGPLHEASDAGWDYTLRLNLTSVFLSNRAAVRRFLEQGGGGSIVNVGSVLATSPSPEYFSTIAYTAAKGAILSMTRSNAARYARDNVRFNVLAPGLVETPMSTRAAGDERTMAFVRDKQPLDGGRIGRPDDLDAAAVFLLSDGARYVTGQVLAVDGGWGVSEGRTWS